MTRQSDGMIERLMRQGALRRWARAAHDAESTDLPDLVNQRDTARQLRVHLDKLIHLADTRLAQPLIGTPSVSQPHGVDWAWRPELWCAPLAQQGLSPVPSKSRLGDEVTLFHDCGFCELTLRQIRNARAADQAAYGLCMDVFHFDGSYLSLSVDLPMAASLDLRRQHLIRIETIVEMEAPLKVFARLNIRHGPNTEQIVRELALNAAENQVEFDLAYSKLNEKRADRMWLDLIFEAPQMNQVVLRDLTFSRRLRAAL
ncbi:DUF6478 family protein [Puniceibacterium sp. IMCC21224]|uniref:DUF6478 family protein n=1 Tax=Puniceibacterium sp. IMCC21224 TaxID=1618204 RepID=UPI00064DAB66|nr:DUF6478 family protein [Puniceibacterium sp. IMCC21224]KMK65823.1 hypothetical protein IMCC21224_11659 [Puniceibacterium sp. IMCC21224]